MSINCCKSYVGKQIIGLLPGGAEECWYLVYLDSNYFGYSNWTGWTLNGNDLVTELTAICQAQSGNVAIRDGITSASVLWAFYLGTSNTTYAAYDPANNETPIPFNEVVQCEACYQFEVPYGENIKGINVANIIEFLSITPVDDEAGLQTELELLFGTQVSVSSVWDGSNYIVTINNAWDPGAGISLVNSSGGEYIGSPGDCPITPPEPVPVALLDAYTGAAAAYSVRKLSSSYTGAALRVRRSSDNTEQDIGFVGLDLDTTALSSFVGAGNGFVTKWYDQSGNNNHGLQSVASVQPQIVFSGSIYTINGKPSLKYIAGNTTSLSLTNNITNPNNYSCFSAMGRNSLGEAISSLSCVTTVFPYTSFIATDNNFYIASNTHYASKPYALTGLKLFSSFWNTPNQIIGYVNSVNQSFIPLALNVAGVFQGIGRRSNTNSNGYISEIIFYPSDKSANRIAIDSNIITYFSIV